MFNLLSEWHSVPDQLLCEDHAVLHVDVPVRHAVDKQKALLRGADEPGAVAAHKAARLVALEIVGRGGEAEVTL